MISFIFNKTGAGLGEYALIAALVAGVSVAAVTGLGTANRDTFASIAGLTSGAGGGAGGSGAGNGPGGTEPPPGTPTDPDPTPLPPVLVPATLDPSAVTIGGSLTADGLGVNPSSPWRAARSTGAGKTSGRWYFEGRALGFDNGVGLMTADVNLTVPFPGASPGYAPGSIGFVSSVGWVLVNGINVGTCASWSTAPNNRVMVAYDADQGLVWFGANGTWCFGWEPGSTGGHSFTPNAPVYASAHAFAGANNPNPMTVNFGQDQFVYTPPAGFTPGWLVEETP